MITVFLPPTRPGTATPATTSFTSVQQRSLRTSATSTRRPTALSAPTTGLRGGTSSAMQAHGPADT
eukprot:jgi/Astpho2/6768/e_gw1.00103.57.1_t